MQREILRKDLFGLCYIKDIFFKISFICSSLVINEINGIAA